MSRDPFFGKNESFVEQVRGDSRYHSSLRASINHGVDWSAGSSVFSQYIVIEVINDPHLFKGGTLEEDNATKLAYKEGKKTRIENDAWEQIPRNSIIAQPVNTSSSQVGDEREVFLPFFPSHMALPCKPGEHVWVMHPSNKAKNSGYWFCRVNPLDFVDDVNHSHYPRMAQLPSPVSSEQLVKGDKKIVPEFRVGATFEDENGDIQTSSDGSNVLTNDEFFYEKLIEESDSSKIMTYESVPRFKKRPGDLVLEGSNNTLIVLGTDRVGEYAIQERDANGRGKKTIKKTNDLHVAAGSIDLVVGRGQTPRTSGKKISSRKIGDGAEFKEELDKLDTQINEGDPDLINDKSRVLISQRTMVDKNLGLDQINQDFNISDTEQGDGAVITKSDKIRIIGRKDLQILIKDDASEDISTIVAKSTGEINIKVKNTSLIIDTSGNIKLDARGDVILNTDGKVKLGTESANKSCARKNDVVVSHADFNTWATAIIAAINLRAPLAVGQPPGPPAPEFIGNIGVINEGSSKVLVSD